MSAIPRIPRLFRDRGKSLALLCTYRLIQSSQFSDISLVEPVIFYVESAIVYLLGGYPFNGPLGGTKYPTRAASPIQNASTPKSSLPFSKHRSCALLCTVVRRF